MFVIILGGIELQPSFEDDLNTHLEPENHQNRLNFILGIIHILFFLIFLASLVLLHKVSSFFLFVAYGLETSEPYEFSNSGKLYIGSGMVLEHFVL